MAKERDEEVHTAENADAAKHTISRDYSEYKFSDSKDHEWQVGEQSEFAADLELDEHLNDLEHFVHALEELVETSQHVVMLKRQTLSPDYASCWPIHGTDYIGSFEDFVQLLVDATVLVRTKTARSFRGGWQRSVSERCGTGYRRTVDSDLDDCVPWRRAVTERVVLTGTAAAQEAADADTADPLEPAAAIAGFPASSDFENDALVQNWRKFVPDNRAVTNMRLAYKPLKRLGAGTVPEQLLVPLELTFQGPYNGQPHELMPYRLILRYNDLWEASGDPSACLDVYPAPFENETRAIL